MALSDYDYPPEEFPPLPDGLFWDVRESHMMQWRELQLRRKRLIGSKKVGWWVIHSKNSAFGDDLQELRRWIKFAMSRQKVRRICREMDAINQHRKGAKA
ncbi:hypothetical protein AUR04nite_00120 [Glutamicibacter uratoxydans]|uniref:Uncharacterized protein n=1 Tax=Glutamicibacter uratoxydans TaxID=43667 RepID=A0A4Y4DLH7_GLUUR|nr:hypothetical protein [Glutamicibacter uratoxydans]GED04480.1 hypothetical protein AUR04nite_00120 [Glutamicibacter uratoxydans]